MTEGNVFTLSTIVGGGSYLPRSRWGGYLLSQVQVGGGTYFPRQGGSTYLPRWGVPIFPGGTYLPRSRGYLPSQVQGGTYLLRWGYLPSQVGGPTFPGGGILPSQAGGGIPFPGGGTPYRNSIACTAMRRAVCLLRSRRRTFLLLIHVYCPWIGQINVLPVHA